ncbi:hypothetical protein M271_24460 [Streptomyces rapamycinicus NRRL 5491]|uniref:Uncharacterized protein n=2 Tax=Streptomyces rapamycinicus TaxID=1226757 RepID=A0A0A0NGS1_STRRN|nr:hypothetical protein M271_24460 [Streptomyces rapamycinicus NRRL 5491]RLV80531.1 hypothetical protein D3C57_119140 [Streptomyces rapamycinicus NRRL 5491]
MHTAGTDPGYIPGLTSPRPADEEENTPEDKAAAEQPPEEVTAEDEPELDEEEGVEVEAESDGETDASKDVVASDGEADDDEEAEDADADGGAVFEVSDRRGAIRAGRRGVTFELDGEKAEFGWDEIGAVEVDAPRFGKRFGITVYTTNRRWYTADVEAPARKLLKEWTAELDAVLDAYFEDSEDGEAEAEAAAEAEGKKADADTGTGTGSKADEATDTDAKDTTS